MSSETKHGGCHCKAVQYDVTIDLSQPVLECNCSICAGKGLLLAFVPAGQMSNVIGESHLTEYRFNTEKIAHRFCNVCGTQVFSHAVAPDGTPTYAINVRTIDGVDLSALTRMPYDGRAV